MGRKETNIMFKPMTPTERRIILVLVALLVFALLFSCGVIYNASLVYDDGTIVLPNGVSFCLPWYVCRLGG
jgi:hypothetical protein